MIAVEVVLREDDVVVGAAAGAQLLATPVGQILEHALHHDVALRVDGDVVDRVLVRAAELLEPLELAARRELDQHRVGAAARLVGGVRELDDVGERAADHPAAVGRGRDRVRSIGVDAADVPRPLRDAVLVVRDHDRVVGSGRLLGEVTDLDRVEEATGDDDGVAAHRDRVRDVVALRAERLRPRELSIGADLDEVALRRRLLRILRRRGGLADRSSEIDVRVEVARDVRGALIVDGDAACGVDAEPAEAGRAQRLASGAARILRERRQRLLVDGLLWLRGGLLRDLGLRRCLARCGLAVVLLARAREQKARGNRCDRSGAHGCHDVTHAGSQQRSSSGVSRREIPWNPPRRRVSERLRA